MAHVSGNPAWEQYPSTATRVDAVDLENIENAIDDLDAEAVSVTDNGDGTATLTWGA